MTSSSNRLTGFVFAPRGGIIWAALAAFFLGSTLCPFNPPAEDGPQPMKQGAIMNSSTEIQTSVEHKHFGGLASATGEIETATFALG